MDNYLFFTFLFTFLLSILFFSYLPLLFFYSLFLAYIIEESSLFFAGIIIIAPILLILLFNNFKNFNIVALKLKIKKFFSKEKKVKSKEISKKKELAKNKHQIKDRIIKTIEEKIEKEKKISFSELAQIWLSEQQIEQVTKEESLKKNKFEENRLPEQINKFKVEKADKTEKERNSDLIKSELQKENEIEFQNDFVKKIYKNYVHNLFFNKDLELLAKHILILLDKVADEPSITDLEKEDDYKKDYFDILKTFTLAEHTFNVVSFAFEEIKKEYQDTWKISWDALCISAVAHDLGKAKLYRDTVVFYGSHKDISQELIKKTYTELFEQNKINIPKEKIDRIANIVGFHHGVVPDILKEDKILNILKKADSQARKIEIEKKRGELKSWKDINITKLGELMLRKIKEKAFSPEASNKVFFVVDEKKGLIFIHKDYIFLSSLREYVKEENIFWPELNSNNEITFINAMKMFIKEKIVPLQWIPQKQFGELKNFFYFINIERNGKILGVRPFLIFLLSVFSNTLKIESKDLISIYKESPLSVFNPMYKKEDV